MRPGSGLYSAQGRPPAESMPRVNRDLQRRMAARRERERRRPTERRYNFTTSEPAVEPDDEALVEQDGQATDAVDDPAPAARAATTTTSAPAMRGGTRAAP